MFIRFGEMVSTKFYIGHKGKEKKLLHMNNGVGSLSISEVKPEISKISRVETIRHVIFARATFKANHQRFRTQSEALYDDRANMLTSQGKANKEESNPQHICHEFTQPTFTHKITTTMERTYIVADRYLLLGMLHMIIACDSNLIEFKEKLGKGGFGLIYSGIDVKTGIQIAIKLVCLTKFLESIR